MMCGVWAIKLRVGNLRLGWRNHQLGTTTPVSFAHLLAHVVGVLLAEANRVDLVEFVEGREEVGGGLGGLEDRLRA